MTYLVGFFVGITVASLISWRLWALQHRRIVGMELASEAFAQTLENIQGGVERAQKAIATRDLMLDDLSARIVQITQEFENENDAQIVEKMYNDWRSTWWEIPPDDLTTGIKTAH